MTIPTKDTQQRLYPLRRRGTQEVSQRLTVLEVWKTTPSFFSSETTFPVDMCRLDSTVGVRIPVWRNYKYRRDQDCVKWVLVGFVCLLVTSFNTELIELSPTGPTPQDREHFNVSTCRNFLDTGRTGKNAWVREFPWLWNQSLRLIYERYCSEWLFEVRPYLSDYKWRRKNLRSECLRNQEWRL